MKFTTFSLEKESPGIYINTIYYMCILYIECIYVGSCQHTGEPVDIEG